MQSEVTEINKQKFLAELGKLLTFMYDEDRQTALNMYSEMFDMAGDEQALLQFLSSPTRQAVIIARAYNARERKLQVNTESKDYEDEGTPDFVRAISALEDEALEREIIFPKVPEEQFSLFEDGIHPVEDALDGKAEAVADEAEESAAPAEQAAAPADVQVAEVVELDDEDDAASVSAETADNTESVVAEVETEEKSTPDDTALADADEVDAFLSDFSIAGDELAQKDEPAEAESEPEKPVKPEKPDNAKVEAAPVNKRERIAAEPRKAPVKQEVQTVELTERKAIIPLLVLYVIIAVPVAAVCVFVLLIPTLLSLLMSVGAVVLGCMALSSAVGAFTMFADVMVVLGVALVILAVGLLLLWLFVWFVGGAIAGLINGIIKLGGKWCYKEVPAV